MSASEDNNGDASATSTSGSGDNRIKSGYVDIKKMQEGSGTTSGFSKAFSNLKKSEFYEEPPPEVKNATEQKNSGSGPTKPLAKNCVIVSSRQRGNPILKSIRNVPWEYGEIVPDYTMGGTTCALFLSLRYHNLNPNYIHDRLKQLGRQYELRVLLVLVDVKDPHHELKQLTKICVMADMTLMLAWSNEEAGRIIEVYKMFEHKPPDLIMEKQDGNPYSMLIDALTSIRSVNRTDAMTLLSTFGSIEKVMAATQEEIAFCPGFGPQKAAKLHKVLNQPFKKHETKSKKNQQTLKIGASTTQSTEEEKAD